MRWLLALMVVTACLSGSRQLGNHPSWRGDGSRTTVGAVVFAPTSEPAHSYNEALQAPPHTPLGDALIAAVKEAASKAGMPAPVADARLFHACAELAEIAPENGIIAYNVVEFALQRHGIIEPSSYNVVVWGEIDKPERIIDQLRPRLAEALADRPAARLGIGAAKRSSDGFGAVVFALQASGVSTSPIPRSVEAGSTFTIDAVLDPRYHDPELFVMRADGQTDRLAIESGRAGAFKAAIRCSKHDGRQQVEITASDSGGSTVLANFPVWCGGDPPVTLTIEPTHEDNLVITIEEAEKRLLALVNRDRQAAGLPALLWDERVAAVSRAYSEEMRKTKLVAHVSPTTGSAVDRVRAAGIKTAVVLENIARAYGIGAAHDGLMNSPGHRTNMLSTQATHVGIGVVLGDEISGGRELFLTQLFIRVPPKVEIKQAADLVRARIDQVRPVVVNAKLQNVAQDLAEGLASGKSRDQLWPGARKKLDQGNTQYARVGSVVSAVAELDAIDGKQLVGDYKPDDIGVGIAQGMHPEIGEAAIWIVVLMAERLPANKRK